MVNQTSIHSNGLKSVGVAPVGEDEVTVVDLHRLFFKSSPRSESERGGYLVIVKNTTPELYGIPVVETPVLIGSALIDDSRPSRVLS